MSTLLFIHGWGFDGGVWSDVLAGLEDFPCAVADLGFFGRPSLPEVERPLVIGHSMGFAWALANLPRPWAGAVAVNAFPRFVAGDGYVGVPGERLAAMRRQFAEDPAKTTATFLARCGVAEPNLADLDDAILGDALAWLEGCDQRDALAALDCPLAVLSGGADPVVRDAMSRAGFAGHDLTMVEGAGHLLPLTHAAAVTAAIRSLGP